MIYCLVIVCSTIIIGRGTAVPWSVVDSLVRVIIGNVRIDGNFGVTWIFVSRTFRAGIIIIVLVIVQSLVYVFLGFVYATVTIVVAEKIDGILILRVEEILINRWGDVVATILQQTTWLLLSSTDVLIRIIAILISRISITIHNNQRQFSILVSLTRTASRSLASVTAADATLL